MADKIDYQKQRMERLGVSPASKPGPSPKSALDKIKAFVSPKSTAGLLRDRPAEVQKKLKEIGG